MNSKNSKHKKPSQESSQATAYPFKVRTHESDFRGQATLPALLDYMQEAAWLNAESLGASVYKLMEEGMTWVMNRMRLEIQSFPSHLEEIKVETWPSGMDKIFAYRDYQIIGQDKTLLAKATSTWLALDTATRKLVRMPEWVAQIGAEVKNSHLGRATGKLKVPDVCKYVKSIKTRWHDLDVNRHVNSVRYFQWVVETLPPSFLESHSVREIDIILKAESGADEELLSSAEPQEDNVFLHKITNKAGKILVLAKTSWASL